MLKQNLIYFFFIYFEIFKTKSFKREKIIIFKNYPIDELLNKIHLLRFVWFPPIPCQVGYKELFQFIIDPSRF